MPSPRKELGPLLGLAMVKKILFVFGQHPEMIIANFWHCVQGSFLVGLRKPYRDPVIELT